MPTIKISRLKRPARKRRKYQPITRRASWEWPDPDKHPVVGVTWNERCQRFYAYCGAAGSDNYQAASFSPDKYGGSRERAKAAAVAWRKRVKDPALPCHGRKLRVEQAGYIAPIYTADGRVRAYRVSLSHDSIRLATSFGAISNPAAALQKAELMLECYREEMRRYTRLTAAQQRALRWA